jgi:hypothetical protein
MIDCRSCKHRLETAVFELCTHPASRYKVAEREDWHTTSHMRQRDCGEKATLFEKGTS